MALFQYLKTLVLNFKHMNITSMYLASEIPLKAEYDTTLRISDKLFLASPCQDTDVLQDA